MNLFGKLFRPMYSLAPNDDGGGGGPVDGGSGDNGGGMDDAIRDLIIRTTNAAVANQLGRKLGPAITEGVTAAIAPIQEQFAKLHSGAQPENDKNKGVTPEMAELIRKQKALEAQLAEERTARETQEKAAKDAQKRSKVQNALVAAGVEPLRMRGAMAEVMDNIHVGEDGKVFYRDTSKGYEDDVSLGDGLARWGETDVGKSYLAAKVVSGSGSRAPGRSGPAPSKMPLDPKAAKAHRIVEAKKALRTQVREMIGGGAGVSLGGANVGGQGDHG